MSTSAVSSSSPNQQVQQYYQTRQSDLRQLGQALQSGNLSEAQTEFNNITTLGQSGPFASGQPFAINQREQDFTAIGQALQNGDLAGAQQAFSQLSSTFPHPQAQSGSNTNTSSSVGPEIVLNISSGSGSAPEQITINVDNSTTGSEAGTTTGTQAAPASATTEPISLTLNDQNAQPLEITLNLGPNSNGEIVLNLLGASSATNGTSSTSAAGSGISVSA
jgi:hypothetical protein